MTINNNRLYATPAKALAALRDQLSRFRSLMATAAGAGAVADDDGHGCGGAYL